MKKLATRIDVAQFKKLFAFCFKWVASSDSLIKRTGVIGVLFLIQGRGQIVKGGLDVILGLASCFPSTLSELKQMENPPLTSTTTDSESVLSLTVGDEYASQTDTFSLFTIDLSSHNQAVDWICYVLLLMECYERFTEPFHEKMREQFTTLSNMSLLLLSEHIFVRTMTVQFIHTYISTEVSTHSLCEDSWLLQPGSSFYILQRLFISYHLPYSLECLELTTSLLTELILVFSEKKNWIVAPKGLYNKELRVLGEVKESNMMKRLKNVEAIRQLYDLNDLVDSDESEELERDSDQEEEPEEIEMIEDPKKQEAIVNETEDAEDSEDSEKMEEEPEEPEEKKATRILQTLKRVPNPHRVVDCLYLIGSTLAMDDISIKKAMLNCFEIICATYSAEEIEENIVIPLFVDYL